MPRIHPLGPDTFGRLEHTFGDGDLHYSIISKYFNANNQGKIDGGKRENQASSEGGGSFLH